MNFRDQSWNFTNFAPELYQICTLYATTKKLSIKEESPHFQTFSAELRKLRNGHGKVMEKYVVKSVGTLSRRGLV